jgi:hypothetical protein
MKRVMGLLGVITVASAACAPGPPSVEERVLSSGQRLGVLSREITGPADNRYLFLAYTSTAKPSEVLLDEMRALWDAERSDVERSGVRRATLQANAPYRFLEVYMVGWDVPEGSLVPHELGCIDFAHSASGRWDEGTLGCCTMGWCDLRGGYPPRPPVIHRIRLSQPEPVAVAFVLGALAWVAAARASKLVCRIHDRSRRWLYGGTLVLLIGMLFAVLPAFPVVWLYRLTRPDALLCSFSLGALLSFFIPCALFAARLGVLLWGGRWRGWASTVA